MGNNLRRIRVLRDLSQEELAAQIGVSRESICRIERGKNNPSLDLALRLSKTLRCSVEDIFCLESDNILQ